MRYLIWQTNSVWQGIDANLHHLQNLLHQWFAKNENPADEGAVLLMPELFASGFSMQPGLFSETENGKVSRFLTAMAKRYSLEILAGVAQEEISSSGNKRFFNRALYFDSQGKQQATYTKQKLFSYEGEEKAYYAGNTSGVFKIAQGKISAAVFICYDLRFPELFREVAEEVEMVVVIANWPKSRQKHWQTLLQARAIENQLWVIGVNRTGVDGNGLEYQGGSLMIDPKGECVLDAGDKELISYEILTDHLKQEVATYRQHFPALCDK